MSDKEVKAARTVVRKVFADAVWREIHRQIIQFIYVQTLSRVVK